MSEQTVTVGDETYRRRPRYSTGWEVHRPHATTPDTEWLWMGNDIDALLDRIAVLVAERDEARARADELSQFVPWKHMAPPNEINPQHPWETDRSDTTDTT